MHLRTSLILLSLLMTAGCQGQFVGADGRPVRPFQSSPAPTTPAAPAALQPVSAARMAMPTP